MVDDHESRPDPLESELVRQDPSLAEIVIEFVEALPERIKQMEESLNASDFEALRTTAHQLKGSGGGYGYDLVTQQARELELHAASQASEECVRGVRELAALAARIAAGAPKPE